MIYVILELIALFLYLNWSKKHTFEVFAKKYINSMIFLLILISGLRNRAVGSNTYRYILSLPNARYTSWSDIIKIFWDAFVNSEQGYKDPGYHLFEKLISEFTVEQIPFLFIIAILTLVPFAYFLKTTCKSSAQIFISFVFFIPMLFINIPNQTIRMSLAFALVCLGYIMMIKKKDNYFFVLIAIAATFHKSSLLVVVFWLCQKFINPKWIFYGAPVLFCIVLEAPEIVISVLEGSTGAYEVYLNSIYYSENSRPYAILAVMVMLYLIIFVGFHTNKIDWKENKLMLIGAAFTFGLTPVVRIDPNMFRLVSYFAPWMMLLLPKAIEAQRIVPPKIMYSFLFFLFLAKACTSGEYKFFWQHMELNDTYKYVADNYTTKTSRDESAFYMCDK